MPASDIKLISATGTPDNLRVLPDGSGLIACLYTAFDEKNPLITKSLAETPIVRKYIARLQRLIEIPFEFLNAQFPHVVFEEIVYHVSMISNTFVFCSFRHFIYLLFIRQSSHLPSIELEISL